MSGSDNGKKENMKAICVVWTVFFAACMAVMLFFAANKTIVIADASQEQAGLSANPVQQDAVSQNRELQVSKTYGVEKSFRVPLPKGVKAENVVVENRYMNRELRLYIQGADAQFYEENVISGDISSVLSGMSEEQEDGILLKIRMNRVLEYRSTMEGNELIIAWYEPAELFEYIVVLDAACDEGETGMNDLSAQESELILQVGRLVQKKFSMENVRLYLIGTENESISFEDRISFADEVKANLYIKLGIDVDEKPETYGICGLYNEEYFIPDFGNVDLADLVTREVTIASGNRAIGLEAAGEKSILKGMQMPATELSLGYLSNPKEEYLLGQEDYREKLADGIINAVYKAVDMLGEVHNRKESTSGGT